MKTFTLELMCMHRVQEIHNELMKKYKLVPQWWFNTILF